MRRPACLKAERILTCELHIPYVFHTMYIVRAGYLKLLDYKIHIGVNFYELFTAQVLLPQSPPG